MPTQLLDQTKELILLIGSDGKIDYANQPAIDKFFVSAPMIQEINFSQLISTNNLFQVMDRILQSPDKTTLEEIALIDKEGKEFYADLRIVHIDDKIALYLTDLTYQMEFRAELAQKVKVIESLSKSSHIRNELDDALEEVMRKSSSVMQVSRITFWLFDSDFKSIECVSSFIQQNGNILLNTSKGEILYKNDLPCYFDRMLQDDVVVTDDVMQDKQTSELVESYLKPNGILSMLDVPIRSDGKMIGVLCFEHTGVPRKWNVFDIKFGILIAQIVSLILEGFEKNKLLASQEELLKMKEKLMQEIKFRVRSSFSIINALLNYQFNKLTHNESKNLIEEIKNHIYGVSTVHELMLEAVDYNQIRFEKYIFRLLGLMQKLYSGNTSINIQVNAQDLLLPISQALPSALIIFELLNHSYKESFKNLETGEVQIIMQKLGNNYQLVVSDNGREINEEMINRKDALCIKLVDIFVQELNGLLQVEAKNGNKFTVTFPVYS